MAKRLRNGRPLDDEREDDFDVNRPDYWQSSALAALPSASETTNWANADSNGRGGEDGSGSATPVAANVIWGVRGPDKMEAGTDAPFMIVRKGDAIWSGQEQSVRLVWGIRGDAELPQTLLDQIAAQLNAPDGPDGLRLSRNRLFFSSEAPNEFAFTIAVDDDPDQTGDGFFLLGLRDASDGTIKAPNVEVKVVGDEGPPPADPSSIDVADAVAVDEGDGAGAPNVLRFVVDRTGDGNFADQEVSFEFETFLRAAPSQIPLAIPDEDYIATSGTVTFGAGVTKVAIDVQIVGDLTPETNELVDFRISEAQGPGGTQIVGRLATGVILNDDEAPFPPSVFSVINAESVLETDPDDPSAEMVFRVIREGVDDFADTTASVNINTYRDLLGSLPQATPGEDYISTGGTLTFAAGQTERLVTVSVLGDSLVENSEEILVRLTNPVGQPGTSIDDGQARGVIIDDDTVGPSFITLSDAPATSEGDPGDNNSLVFEITRTGVGGFIDAPVSVDYTTWRASSSDGTPAQPREDYAPTFGVFTFAAGQTAGFITVGILEDTKVEDNEVVLLRISDPDGPTGSEIVRPDALGVILDDDAPSFNLSRFSISDPQAVTEGDPGNPGEMVFEISRSGSGNFSNAPAAVNFRTIDSTPSGGNQSTTAGEDYLTTAGALQFAAGETSKLVTVQLVADLNAEGDERLTVELFGPSGPPGTFIVDGRGTGDVLDDDLDQVSASHFSISDAEWVLENDPGQGFRTLKFDITREGDGNYADAEAVLQIETAGRVIPFLYPPATEGVDFVDYDGSFTFAAGETLRTFQVPILPDNLEEENEGVAVRLLSVSGAAGSSIVDDEGVGVIVDDDTPITRPSLFSISDAPSVSEGDEGSSRQMIFEVTRTGGGSAIAAEASVRFITVEPFPPVTNAASAGSDYVFTASTLTFAPGQTLQTVAVEIIGDDISEANEIVFAELSNPQGPAGGVILGDGRAEGTIVDDEPSASASIFSVLNAQGAPEGDPGDPGNSIVFQIIRTGSGNFADGTASVDFTNFYDIIGPPNQARPNVDYMSTTGTLVFEAGETAHFVTVEILPDTITEANEFISLRINNAEGPTGTTVADGEGIGFILDDDTTTFAPSRFSISDPQAVIEGDPGDAGEMVFLVSRTGTGNFLNTDAAVNFQTIDSTPTSTQQSTTPGDDYQATSGVLQFAAGETAKLITVQLTADLNVEDNELLTVELFGPSGPPGTSIIDSRGTGEVIDDDLDQVAASNFSISDADWAIENIPGQGWQTLQFDIYREGTGNFADAEAVLQIETVGRVIPFLYPPATEGVDFIDYDGSFTFAAGETLRTFHVPIFADNLEEENEGVAVRLLSVTSGAAGSTIVDDEGIGVIIDDDTPITDAALFSISNAESVFEGDPGSGTRLMTFEVSRTTALAGEASVRFVTVEPFPPVSNAASAGSDYVFTATTLTFAPGETLQTVSVEIIGDNISEGNEVIFAQLSNPQGPAGGAILGDGMGEGTIVDDEPAASASIFSVRDASSVSEGDPGDPSQDMVFEVVRTGSGNFADGIASVDFTNFYDIIGPPNQARPNDDYTSTTGTLVFETGETSQFVTVAILPDSLPEQNEFVSLRLNNAEGPAGTSIADREGVGYIIDDDGGAGRSGETLALPDILVLDGDSFVDAGSNQHAAAFDPAPTVQTLLDQIDTAGTQEVS